MEKLNLHLANAVLHSNSGISVGCQDTATACAAAVPGFPGKVSPSGYVSSAIPKRSYSLRRNTRPSLNYLAFGAGSGAARSDPGLPLDSCRTEASRLLPNYQNFHQYQSRSQSFGLQPREVPSPQMFLPARQGASPAPSPGQTWPFRDSPANRN